MAPFVARQRKHKIQRREAAVSNTPINSNSNQVQIVPATQSERDEKRRKLKDELIASQANVSGKKQKRLDKYIETKLKKDENLELLKKLSQPSAQFDTSRLQSSRNLGKRKFGDFAEDVKLRSIKTSAAIDNDSDAESNDSFEQEHADAFKATRGDVFALANGSGEGMMGRGSGLKQPLVLGADGLPALRVREKQRKKISRIHQEPTEIPWEGFDTEPDQPDGQQGTSELSGSDGERLEGDSVTSGTGSEDDDEGDDEAESDASEQVDSRLKPRNSAFKTWATQQINQSLDYTPQHTIDHTRSTSTVARIGTTSRDLAVTQGLVGIPVANDAGNGLLASRIAYSVVVTRSDKIQDARLSLPIVAEEQKIMEAIHNNPVTIIWGATGSGKTTQVPQFLFEAGYGDPTSQTSGIIGLTQPRRVAAVSMAKRVSDELGQHGSRVAYQIRFESTTSPKTAIKFMTDGILLREISQDISLEKYSVIVIDEAHERSVNTDILIGMLSRIVDQRARPSLRDGLIKPLKLVIMSATLRISDFMQNAHLFRSGAPPFVQAEGRQYPVTVHFARRTHRDYVEETFRKVTKGHRKLPPGGILVFLTGQGEIRALLIRLQAALSSRSSSAPSIRVHIAASEAPQETEDLDLGLDLQRDQDEDSDLEIVTHDDDDYDDAEEFDIGESPSTQSDVHILPLYSQLPTKEQLRIFEEGPPGSRLIVLATNVAETSLTIPGIRYVFDCGRSKERFYDPMTGVQSFEVDWISKASAEQRAGRAGRTAPGHCYRLYSSAVYERDFVQHADPEILRTPMESVVLSLKSMSIDKVAQFPFPTPPDRQSLLKAERLLRNLGALSDVGRISALGKSLSNYPLSPRFGKMLAISEEHEYLPYVIALVAGLAVGDLFISENQIDMTPVGRQEDQIYSYVDQEQDTQRELRRKRYNESRAAFSKWDRTSDALKVLTAVCGYAWEDDQWCDDMFLRSKPLKEVTQLRKQLFDIVRANLPGLNATYTARLRPASSIQLKAINQIVTAGFIDQVAIRADCAPNPPEMPRRPKRSIDVPYLPLFPLHKGNTLEQGAVYLHPSSILARLTPEKLPKYVIYSHLQQSAASHIASDSSGVKSPKIRMFPLTSTGDLQLAALAHGTPLLTYGKPIGKIESLGGFPEVRECWVVPFLIGEAGTVGWPLTAKKVRQRKDPKAGWTIEKLLS